MLFVLLLVQVPRLGGPAGKAAAPVFPPHRGYLDFDRAYYPAGLAIRTNPSQLYRGAVYDRAANRLHITAPAYFVNIPLVAWLFVPFTALPLPQAGTALLLFNIAISLACLFILQRRVAGWTPAFRWAITVAFATSGPLMNALNLGQTTPLVLLLLLLAEGSLHREREARAGLWLGLACLIKIPPLLFVAYFALRRRWRVVAAALGVALAAAAASVLLYGWPLHAAYYDLTIRANFGKALAAHNCQSIDAFLARLFTDAPLSSWQPIAPSTAVRALKWVLAAGMVAACGWALRRPVTGYGQTRLELGAVLCLSLVLLPVSWAHYGIWMLPVAVTAGGATGKARGQDCRRWVLALIVIAVALINFPVLPLSVVKRLGDQVWFRLAISHQLFGTILLLGTCVRYARRAADKPEAAPLGWRE